MVSKSDFKAALPTLCPEFVPSQKAAGAIYDAVMEFIADQMATGQVVQLQGIGTLRVERKKAKPGRNPRTGESIVIPERNVPKFKATQALKDKINQ